MESKTPPGANLPQPATPPSARHNTLLAAKCSVRLRQRRPERQARLGKRKLSCESPLPLPSLVCSQVLEFDQPGAATTEALAEAEGGARTLEEIITQRCKEALWDDVVRKAALRPGEFKPR